MVCIKTASSSELLNDRGPGELRFRRSLKTAPLRFHDLLCRGVAEESPPLFPSLRVSERSVMLNPVSSRHQLLTIRKNGAMPVSRLLASRQGRQNSSPSSNARRPATGRSLEGHLLENPTFREMKLVCVRCSKNVALRFSRTVLDSFFSFLRP
jgi:hypothetical protein